MESKRCHFVFLTGPRAGEAQNFDAARITIGRASTCDVQFDPYRDLSVASHHAEILLDDGVFYVFDLGTRTGTYVNGERIAEKHSLRHEDYLQFGKDGPEVIFRLGWAPEGKQEIPPPPPPIGELEFFSGSDAGRTFLIRGDRPARVGRRADMEVSLNPRGDMMVSGNHCTISYEDGEFIVTDTSRNGTFVNGAPVRHRAYLRDGDVLTLGPGGPRARFRILPPQRDYPNRSGTFPRAHSEEIPTREVSAETLARREREARQALAREPVEGEKDTVFNKEGAQPAQAASSGVSISVAADHPSSARPLEESPAQTPVPGDSNQKSMLRFLKHPVVVLVVAVFVVVFGGIVLLTKLSSASQKTIPQVAGLPDYLAQVSRGADKLHSGGRFTFRLPVGWNVLESGNMVSLESPDKTIAVDYVRDEKLSEESVREILSAKGTKPILVHRSHEGEKQIVSFVGQGPTKCWLALLHIPPQNVPALALIEVESDIFKRLPNQLYALLGIEQFRLQPYPLPNATPTPKAAPTATPTTSPSPAPTSVAVRPSPTSSPSPTPAPTPVLTPSIPPPTVEADQTTSPTVASEVTTDTRTQASSSVGSTKAVQCKTLGLTLNVPESWDFTVDEKEGIVVLRTALGAELRLTRDKKAVKIEDITDAMTQNGWTIYYRNDKGAPLPNSSRRFYAVGLFNENNYVLIGVLPNPDRSSFVIYALREGKSLDECKDEIQQIVLQLAAQSERKKR
ncbi:MAG: FHA domain-containing protein [Candidatus Hydrogenedentota bacterium]|nr:FHA domain-containing protein [Candidatus Sumerlaea chitinivorans]RMH28839.1 MAG: FHA domain-containing protein [Candidatus Hydrogenedentota bacterium]GIX44099.1 MAG: hypothetical protein KatS3mg130_0507 [Candidatus Sumerlaea sp.]